MLVSFFVAFSYGESFRHLARHGADPAIAELYQRRAVQASRMPHVQHPQEAVADEVAAALTLTGMTAGNLVDVALTLDDCGRDPNSDTIFNALTSRYHELLWEYPPTLAFGLPFGELMPLPPKPVTSRPIAPAPPPTSPPVVVQGALDHSVIGGPPPPGVPIDRDPWNLGDPDCGTGLIG